MGEFPWAGENPARTAYDLLAQHDRLRPDQVCLNLLHSHHDDRAVTYRALLREAAGYAHAYDQAGIQPGEVVILILQHGMDLIASFWGAILHGAIPSIMPFLTEKLLPDRYRRDLAALIEVTRPACIVTYPDFVEEVRSVAAPGGPVHAVLLSSDVQSVDSPDFSRMGGRSRRPEEIVFLQHSSGTTGLQKGVAISHRALMNQLNCYGQAIRLVSEDVIVSWLPLYHDMGLIAGFLMPVLMGVPLVLMSPFDWVKAPYRLMQAVSKYHGTLSWLPNFAYAFCAQKTRDAQLQGVDLSTWRAVINCSEPMYVNSMQAFAERFVPYGLRPSAMATSYAMAENVFGVTQGGIDGPVTVDVVDVLALQGEKYARPAVEGRQARQPLLSVKMLSCGAPIPGTQVRVLSAAGQALGERQVGELAVRSNCMLEGYFHRPDATEKVFVDGWYLTGDYGYMAGGEIYVTGRKKDLIIVGGRNIFPQDIEAAAGEVAGIHPGRVVAFGILNEDLGTEEVGLVAEVDLSEEDLATEAVRQRIEDAIRLAVNRGTAVSLRYIRLVGPHWLVKTSSGKIARSANRDKFLSEMIR
jgi:fatty-acyl-CoA synthase